MIREALLTTNDFSRPGLPLRSVHAIVLHWVGNAGTSAEMNRRYFQSLETGPKHASAHFIIDHTEIIRCIPENEVAYHCGVPDPENYTDYAKQRWGGEHPNWYTLGIEHCHPDWTGVWEPATIKQSHLLCAGLCLQYHLNPEVDIIRHWDVTGKDCPLWMVKDPQQLAVFQNAVKIIMEV
jgi:N-acetylmuramoyl-L-alanine amidase